MSNLNPRISIGLRRIGAAATAAMLVCLPGVLLAEDGKLPPRLLGDKPVTAATLLDRIQIEDLLTKYYYDLSAGKAHELSEYFTQDALLDVDSTIARGHAEIARLYQRPPGTTRPAAERRHMLLTNPVINVDGDKATAEVIWTGVINDGVGKVPRLYEEGREYSELRKINGKWLISKRCISSDSGLPDKYDATYKPRERC
jgi:hypothetical protein